MTKNIIIVDKELERIKYIINNIKLILIFKDMKRIGDIFNKYNIFYYRKYY